MADIRFILDRDHVDLHQLLKLAGIVNSGGAGKALVGSGAVAVDGTVESRKSRKLRGGELVEVHGQRIAVVAAGG